MTGRDDTAPRAMVIGDSHIAAVLAGSRRRARKVRILRAIDVPGYKSRRRLDPGRLDVAPDTLVFELFGGNIHSIMSVIELDPPVDFVCPHVAEIDDSRQIVPYSLVREAMARQIKSHQIDNVEKLRSVVPRVVHVASPPPVAEAEHILEHPGRFAEVIHRGIAPKHVRMKFYRLQNDIVAEYCARHGIDVIEPPADALDEEGFLLKDFASADPTHANARYGALLLDKIEQHADS